MAPSSATSNLDPSSSSTHPSSTHHTSSHSRTITTTGTPISTALRSTSDSNSNDATPSNDPRLLAAIIVLVLVAAGLIAFIIWLTLRVKRREEGMRRGAAAEAVGIGNNVGDTGGSGIATGASGAGRRRGGGSVDRRDKAGKVTHADHPAAQITPFGGAPLGVGAGRPRFGHRPGEDMRIALRRPDGAWDFADPRTPFTPAGVGELDSDVVPAVSPLTRLSINLLGMSGAHLLTSPGGALGDQFSPLSPAVAAPERSPFSPLSPVPEVSHAAAYAASQSPFSPISPGPVSAPGAMQISLAPSHTRNPLLLSHTRNPQSLSYTARDPLSQSTSMREPSSPFSYVTDMSHAPPRDLTATATQTHVPSQPQRDDPHSYNLVPEPREHEPSSPFSYVTDPAYAQASAAAARKEEEAGWERERREREGEAAPPAYWERFDS